MIVNCVILARGGSKGIPGKNIIDFCGKPLLAWTIEQCLQAESVNSVWVSSDDKPILAVAEKYGAKLIERPVEISDDFTTSESAWLHAVNYLEKRKIITDVLLAPQATSPLRTSDDIEKAISTFENEKLDSLFSASIAEDLYYWERTKDGGLNSVNYDYLNRKRRQDFHPQIIENGSFYLFKPDILKKENNRFGGKIGYSKMEFWKMFEIDTLDDLRMCSSLMNEFLINGDGSND